MASAPGWWGEIRATLALGWPLILTNLAQTAIGATDTAMMGHLGSQALAAGTLGVNLYLGVFILGMGLVLATQPLLAQLLGRRRHAVRECRRVVRQGGWLAAFYCLPAWVLLWHGEAVLRFTGQDPVLAQAAGTYERAMMWGLAPALGVVVLRSFLAAQERPRAAMVVSILAIFLNALVNWLLVFGHFGLPSLGLIGSGVASSLSNLFMLAVLAGFVLVDRRFRRYHLFGHWWRADWPKFRELLRVGTPMGLAMGFEISGFNAAALLMGLIGPAALAAHAISLQVASITFMVPLGLGQAATVRVGLAVGAGKPAAAGRAGWSAWGLGIGFMTMTAVALTRWPGAIAGLFLNDQPESLAVKEQAILFLSVAALFQIADGAQVVGAGMLRGLKDTRMPMVYAGIGYWVLAIPLGLALAFPLGLGGVGIWIGLAGGLGVVAVLVTTRWRRRERLGLLERSNPG